MYERCPLCGGSYKSLALNSLPMRQCVNCGLIWRQQFDFDAGYFKEGKLDYRVSNSRCRVKQFSKLADLNNLCDIGTADGSFLKALQEFGYKNVIGIEPNPKNLEFVKGNNLVIINGGLDSIKSVVDSHNINTVSMFNLIEHLPNPVESLKLIFESMKQGGRLILTTPDIEAYIFKRLDYKHKTISLEHLFYFNKSNLIRIIEKTGFKIVALGKTGESPNGFSIRECLFRLGLVRKNQNGGINKTDYSDKVLAKENLILKSKIKELVRAVLNKLVAASGRLEHIWLVAEK